MDYFRWTCWTLVYNYHFINFILLFLFYYLIILLFIYLLSIVLLFGKL